MATRLVDADILLNEYFKLQRHDLNCFKGARVEAVYIIHQTGILFSDFKTK